MAKEKKEAPAEREESPKQKALSVALALINKSHGNGAALRYGDSTPLDVPKFHSGTVGLDSCLGGGYAKGRIIEIFGPESSGKTTLTLHAIAEIQKSGGIAAFVDAEHAMDPRYAAALGVDMDNLVVSQPDNGEQALDIVEKLVMSNAVDLVVVDSVAALVPKAEIEGEMGDSHVGLQARLMSQALRKLTGIVHKSHTTVIFINQIRMKIGVKFGSPETTTGGNALKFYASQRLDIRRIGAVKEGERITGNRTRVKVVKNKVAPPFRECEFEIRYGQGVDKVTEVIEAATDLNLVEKSGAWYAYEGERMGQGKPAAVEWLRGRPEVLELLSKQVLQHFITTGAVTKPGKKEVMTADGEILEEG